MGKGQQCIEFLQWALPRLHFRWEGFRKVRSQPCKKIVRRIQELELSGYSEYQEYLEENPSEWEHLHEMCRITISRFYRDRGVFDALKEDILPELARACPEKEQPLRCWSAGCASGEEPYTLALIHHFRLSRQFPELNIEIIATDVEAHMLERARQATYSGGSLKNLPDKWIEEGFNKKEEEYELRPEIARKVEFLQQDIREEMPEGNFQLILCRNLAAMYFDEELQLEIFGRMREKLSEGGFLILGKHGKLPDGLEGFTARDAHKQVFVAA